MENKNNKSSRLWVALPTAILAGALNVFLFFLFMVLYGYVIDPGQQDSHYQEAASKFGPYASIIGGIPVMFLAGLTLRRFFGRRALRIGIAAWAIYLALDLAIIIAVGQLITFLPHIFVSFSTKLMAIYLGSRTSAQKGDPK
jgi:hypothetical protein